MHHRFLTTAYDAYLPLPERLNTVVDVTTHSIQPLIPVTAT